MSDLALSNAPDLDEALEQAYETYTAKRPKSLQAFEEASEVMPGGNTRSVLFHNPFPFHAATGEGSWLTDVDGNRLLNLLGEYTAGLFGHNHPVIQEAVSKVLADGVNLGAQNNYERHFAKLVCERFPSIEKVRFTNSGTEANLMAITAARAFTGRSKILVFEGGYHGGVFLFKPGVETNAPFSWITVAYNDSAAAANAIQEHGSDLAAVIVEPMLGSGGCIAANADFLATLRRETRDVGSLLILDEVMTSRLGKSGAQEIYGVESDLTTLGKWIGGGMSFGAFGGRTDVMDQFDPRRSGAISHAGTFNNNVMTMSAGIAALSSIYTSDAAEEFSARGGQVRERLNNMTRNADVPIQFTGMGSIMAMHPTKAKINAYSDVAGIDDRLREILFLDLLDAGYYIASRGFIALSLAINEHELEGFYDAFAKVLDERADLLRAHIA